jgi:hypothetical protein
MWLGTVMWSVAFLLTAAGAWVLAASRPWGTAKDGRADVILGCASVVALGSIIAGAMALPVGNAVNLGPGYTTGLIRSPRLWLPGLAVAPLTVFLFWLAAQDPDREAALGAALIAGGAYAAIWSGTRSVLGSADSLAMVQREGKRLRRNVRKFMAHSDRFFDAACDPNLDEVLRERARELHRINMGAAPVRQLCTTARRLVSQGSADDGLMFYDEAIGAFGELVDANGGAMGPYNGVPAVLVESLDGSIRAAMSNGDDQVGVHLVSRLAALGRFPSPHTDASKLRLQAQGHLGHVLEATWDDQRSRVPPNAAGQLGSLPPKLLALGAFADAKRMLPLVGDIVIRAHTEHQAQLTLPAMDGFVETFEMALRIPDGGGRRGVLRDWRTQAQRLMVLALIPSDASADPIDQLVPGLGVSGSHQLQQILLSTVNQSVGPDAWNTVLLLVRGSLPQVAALSNRPSKALDDFLELLLCVGQVLASSKATLDLDVAQSAGEAVVQISCDWAGSLPEAVVAERLGRPEVAQLVWSCVLTGAFVAGRRAAIDSAAAMLAERFVDTEPPDAAARLIAGLRSVADPSILIPADPHPGFDLDDDVLTIRSALVHVNGITEVIVEWVAEHLVARPPAE